MPKTVFDVIPEGSLFCVVQNGLTNSETSLGVMFVLIRHVGTI